MHVTLHITTGCNMKCGYCYSPPEARQDMTEETARRAIDYTAEISPVNPGLIFFGGEPLLRKDIIESSISHCREIQKKRGIFFHFKVTTNGTLMNDAFLEYAAATGLMIGMSMDGVRASHDRHRMTTDGAGTYDTLELKLEMLLRHQPYANVLMTVSPETVEHFAESVEFLFGKGVKYLILSLNYAGAWTDSHVAELRRQYAAIAKLYERMTLAEKKFYFSPFETKFETHIKGEDAMCHRCAFGKRQVSVAPDGAIYPCVQFVRDGVSNRQYSIGDVWTGINEAKQTELYDASLLKNEACKECALRSRCNNDCSCLNWQSTGFINEVSPSLCETERVLIPIVDRLGERLYRKRAPMFIQKHYNTVYPVLSLLDDMNQ